MIRLAAKIPIKVKLLILLDLEIIIFACILKEGVGGTIHYLGSSKKLLVLRFLHTEEIKQSIAS